MGEAVKLSKKCRMVLFDMDNTILQGRFIDTIANELGVKEKLDVIRLKIKDPFMRTKMIAALLAGRDFEYIARGADSIPIVPDTAEVIEQMKKNDCIIGIITDSYQCVAERVRQRIGADFVLANQLMVFNGKTTGGVIIPEYFRRQIGETCEDVICKTHGIVHMSRISGIPLEDMVAVGDGENDCCMIRHVGLGVAFCPTSPTLAAIAKYKIEVRSFRPLLGFLGIS